ncbi:MAG: MBL fold metallo-hydrolase [Bacilli bacterium]|jgi:glyoxylase-like metal-dependent hydrolase (beta-lactamase superfamily II)|nr:MBL fold metallo-hydrolase [Bacilli bacterium]
MKFNLIINSFIDENTYIIYDNNTALIIDPGSDFNKIDTFLKEHDLINISIYLTHSHIDHILSCDKLVFKYNAPIYVHKDEIDLLFDEKQNMSAMYDNINIKDAIAIENILKIKCLGTFNIYHVPGHTKGHSMLEAKELNALFSGDFVFYHEIGRCDLPTGNYNIMLDSLDILKTFTTDYDIYPGHGPQTSIKDELKHNPYIRR